MVEHRNVTNFFAGNGRSHSARPAGNLAGGDQSLVRHLGARAVLDHGARLQGRAPTEARRSGGASGRHRLQPVLFRQRRRREGRRQVRASARRGQVRRPARLRRGVDAGAALRCVRRLVSQSGRHQRRAGRRSPESIGLRAGSCVSPLAPPHPDRRGVVGRRQPLRRPRRDLLCFRLAAERLRAAAGAVRQSPRHDVSRHRHRPPAMAGGDAPLSRPRPEGGRRPDPAPARSSRAAGLGHRGGKPGDVSPGGRRRVPDPHPPAGSERGAARREAVRLPYRVAGARTSGRRLRDADAPHVRRRTTTTRCARSCASR